MAVIFCKFFAFEGHVTSAGDVMDVFYLEDTLNGTSFERGFKHESIAVFLYFIIDEKPYWQLHYIQCNNFSKCKHPNLKQKCCLTLLYICGVMDLIVVVHASF